MAEQPHRLMCDSVVKGGNKQLHLWPRGHFKSSVITIGYSINQVIKNPNIRILIANVTSQNAKAFLREIKGHFERNQVFRLYFGDHVSKDDKWTETEIISNKRTLNLKEPTIMVAGVGQALTGMHFDLIIGDDLVNYDTVNTGEQIAKTNRWWADAMSLLEPGGQVILIGTRYHFADLYGRIIETMADEYKPQVHSAFLDDGTPLFPSRFTPEVLNGLRKEQGSWRFSLQYLNSPIDDETAKFKKANFKYYKEQDIEDRKLYTTMTVDRAYSLNKTADFTGITVRSVDVDNNWYIRHARRYKANEGEIIKTIFDLRDYFRVDLVGIEQKAFKDTLKPVLEEEMRRRNSFFSVVELVGRMSKIARIEGLVPRFESGSVFMQEDQLDLEDELLRFPVAQHDDLADSLAYHNDLSGSVVGGGAVLNTGQRSAWV